ncbi:MAG: molybdopterin molybdenumtransferase MoeA, partial [Chloroflexi bacterium]|nr:molybdopterin molybdenumtransferase MoeA [Chloroflexota bacterium]
MSTYDGMPSMLSVEEAQEKIMGMFAPLEPERKPILEALGQVLAEDVAAEFDIPPLSNSGMDGYAVRCQSIQGATAETPKVLRLIGQVAAGQLPRQEVVPGTAVRIMTGAPIPSGADAVVPFEDTDEFERKAAGDVVSEGMEVKVRVDLPKGANIRPAGQDIRRGQVVLTRGTVLR